MGLLKLFQKQRNWLFWGSNSLRHDQTITQAGRFAIEFNVK